MSDDHPQSSLLTRRVLGAEDVQRPQDGDARCVHRDDDHRLLSVRLRAAVRLPHEDAHLAPRVICT